jgi:MoaA/NifB/PqqE/SkfB family radical SAM enzyme
MCSIWKIKEHREIPPAIYAKLPRTLRDVNISGGEPFLRKDLAEIVRVLHHRLPRARMVVSSNGMMGENLIPRAMELVDIFPRIGFAFSVDGVGETHDYIRGVKGAYKNVIEATRGLRDRGIKNIRIAFTLTEENPDHMIRVYRLARELDVQYTMQVSHDSGFFFGENESSVVKEKPGGMKDEKLKKDFETIINGELSSFRPKRWGKAFIHYGTYAIALEGRQLFSSYPGEDFFYLDPKGDIYPSVIHDHVMGNMAEDDFDTIWRSERSERIRRKCLEENKSYWMGCMLRKALLDHKFQIGMWAMKSKIFNVKL